MFTQSPRQRACLVTLSLACILMSSHAENLCGQFNPCPPIGVAQGESTEGFITRKSNGCQVQEGFYVKEGTPLRLEGRVTAYGGCQQRIFSCNPYPCHCDPWGQPVQRL